MTPSKRNLRPKLLFITLFLVICATCIVAAVYFILDSAPIKQEVSDFLSKELNTPATTQNINLKFFPRPCIRIEGLSIEIKGKGNLFISETLLYPNLISLAGGKVEINRIWFKKVLTSLPGPISTIADTTRAKWLHLILPERLNFFSMLPVTQKELAVVVENFHSDLFQRADASFVMSVKNKTAKGEVSIRELNVKNGSIHGIELGKTITSLTALRVKSRFSYSEADTIKVNLELMFPRIVLNDPKAPEISGKEITANAVLTKDSIKVYVDPALLESPQLTCAIDFKFDRTTKAAAIKFKGKDVNIDKTRSAALDLFKENNVCHAIFSILEGGFAPLLTVSFNSDNLKELFDPERMLITGDITKGVVKIPKTPLMVSKIRGKVTMAKGTLKTDVTEGYVDGALVSKGSLAVDILTRHNDFEGNFDLSSDLSMLPGALKRLLPDTMLSRELDRCGSISGKAMGILHLKSDHDHLDVSVKATEIELRGKYNRIPGAISIIAKEFFYGNNSITVNNMNAASDLGTIENVTGVITLECDPFLSIEGDRGLIDSSRFFPWLTSFVQVQTALPQISTAAGKIRIDHIAMEGPVMTPELWRYQSSGSLIQVTLGNKISESEIHKASCSFNVSQDKALLTDIYATINNPRLISFLTKKPKINELAMPINLSKGFFTNSELSPKFTGLLKFDRRAELTLDIEGNFDAYAANLVDLEKKDRTNARISNQDGHLNFQGRLDTRTLETLFDQESPTLKKLLSLTQGKGILIESDTNDKITVTADFIDLDVIRKLDTIKDLDVIETSGKTTEEAPLLKEDFYNSFTLKANTLKYRGYLFNPVEAQVTLSGKTTSITILNSQLCTLDINGTIINNDGVIDIHGTSDISNGDLNKTLSCIYGKNNLIKGTYSLKADLRASGSERTLANNLNGVFSLTSSGGRIYKLTVLSRILSVINISKLFNGKLPDIEQDGFAYNSFNLDAEVKDNRIVIKNAVIDGVDMTIIFTGWINRANDTMELTCLIAPFKTADLLIEKIPILGRILNGRLVSIPLKVTGSRNDPEVFLLPPAAVGKGLMGTMQRILETPFKLIENLPSN